MKKKYESPQIVIFNLMENDIVTSSVTQEPSSLQNGVSGTGSYGSFGDLFG